MKNKQITRKDFSVEKIVLKEGQEIYHAYCHFAPYHFGDYQRGQHKFYKSTGETKDEAINSLLKVVIKHLQEQIND